MLLKFKEFFNKTETEQKFDCIMFDVYIREWENILSYIDDADLYNDETNDFGKEHTCHVTLLYGIHSNLKNKKKTISFIEKLNKFIIHIKNVSYFTSENYYVLKLDVSSDYLNNIRNKIIDIVPNTQTFTEYNPHITLCYLKKDVDVDKYTKLINNIVLKSKKEYTISSAIYSDYNYDKKYIEFGN